MPSFTEVINSASDITFRDLVLIAATEVDYCSSLDGKKFDIGVIPVIEVDDGYQKRVDKHKERLQEFHALSDTEHQINMDAFYVQQKLETQTRIETVTVSIKRLKDLLDAARSWEPKELGQRNLNYFIIRTLDAQLDRLRTEITRLITTDNEATSLEEYKAAILEDLAGTLKRSIKSLSEHVKRAETANKWLQDLADNLAGYNSEG